MWKYYLENNLILWKYLIFRVKSKQKQRYINVVMFKKQSPGMDFWVVMNVKNVCCYFYVWSTYVPFRICDPTYQKVPVVRRLDFELWECKVKISQNMFSKSILRFHIFWNLQYLIFKVLQGFCAKTVFSCKNDLWIAKIPILCTDSQILWALFSKSTFHQSVVTSSMKLPYVKNAMSDFKNSCTKTEMTVQPFRK